MKRGLSGYIPVRNAIEFDYCVEAAIASLVPLCDEVVVCDSDSTDNTREMLDGIARQHQHVRVINREWHEPCNDVTWFVRWINWIRERLEYDMQLELDADEVVCPSGRDAIVAAVRERGCRLFDRHNFWWDARHLAPENHACGRMVARLGPTELWMPSDEPNPLHAPNVRTAASADATLRIFHYGFLRETPAFYRKSRAVQRYFFNTYDERLASSERDGVDWRVRCPFPEPLVPFTGEHPAAALPWLHARRHVC